MATPKTPFCSHSKHPLRERSYSGTPPVLGVVSRDSFDNDDNSSGTPQPSPLAPPAPQMRLSPSIPATDATSAIEKESVHSIPLEVRPPSPYSPPPESAWSETTDDQWPVNHTKRQFHKPTTPWSNSREIVNNSAHSADQYSSSVDISMRNLPHLPHVLQEEHLQDDDLASPFSVGVEPSKGISPRLSQSKTPASRQSQRSSGLPQPSSSRRPYTTSRVASDTDSTLFLMREEHKLLRQDYSKLESEYIQNHNEWERHCHELEQKLATQDALMQRQQEALQHQNLEIGQAKKNLVERQQELSLEHQAREDQVNQQFQEQAFKYDQLVEKYTALEEEKKTFKKSTEELLHAKDSHVLSLKMTIEALEEELARCQESLKKYEDDVVSQNKTIMRVEENLEQCQTALKGVQHELTERGNEWNVERQRLEDEKRELIETLASKDGEKCRALEEERRRQARQVNDLESQAAYLSNSLAEYQGRFKELRGTVDEHLKESALSVSVSTQNVACQTDFNERPSSTEISVQTEVEKGKPLPMTPSVRFVDTETVSFRSAESTPLSAFEHTSQTALQSMQSGSASSQPISEASMLPTPAGCVSPWIPTWQGRPLHTPADPPSTFSPPSGRSLPPPALESASLRRVPSPPAAIQEGTANQDYPHTVRNSQPRKEIPVIMPDPAARELLLEIHRKCERYLEPRQQAPSPRSVLAAQALEPPAGNGITPAPEQETLEEKWHLGAFEHEDDEFFSPRMDQSLDVLNEILGTM